MGWVVVMGVSLLLLSALLAPFRVEIQLRKNSREDYLALKYSLGPWEFFQSRTVSLLDNLPSLLSYYLLDSDRDLFPATKEKLPIPSHFTKVFSGQGLLKKAGIRHLEWSTRVGTANPALTGIIAGSLWHLKHRLYRYLVEATAGVFDIPCFTVVPDFQETTLELEFRCIFAFRGGHIITAAGRTVWLILCSFFRGDKVEQPSH